MATKKTKEVHGSARGRRAQGLREKIGRTAGGSDIIRNSLQAFDSLRVMPLEPTVLKYMFGYTGIPLGRAMTLVGPPGCCKSVMAHYFSALLCNDPQEGMVGFVDAEKKTSEDQVAAIYRRYAPTIKNKEDLLDARLIFSPHFQEDVFEDMNKWGKYMLQMFEEGERFPWGVTVDSLNYLMSKDFADKLAKGEGTPGYVHMHKANALRSFLGVWLPVFLNDYPALLVGVNHQQERTEQKGHISVTKKAEAGGVFKDFAWSYNFELAPGTWAKSNQQVIKQAFTMRSKKSTGSENGRKVGIVMETTKVHDEAGEYIGIDVNLDFNSSLAELLAGKPKWDQNNSATSAEFRDSIGLSCVGTKYSCTAIGLKDVSAKELGAALEQAMLTDDNLRNAIHGEIGIMSKPEMKYDEWVAPSDNKILKKELVDFMEKLKEKDEAEAPPARTRNSDPNGES
jgi:hypothetical protein